MFSKRPEIQANKKVEILQMNDKLSQMKNSKALLKFQKFTKVWTCCCSFVTSGIPDAVETIFLYLSPHFFLLLRL